MQLEVDWVKGERLDVLVFHVKEEDDWVKGSASEIQREAEIEWLRKEKSTELMQSYQITTSTCSDTSRYGINNNITQSRQAYTKDFQWVKHTFANGGLGNLWSGIHLSCIPWLFFKNVPAFGMHKTWINFLPLPTPNSL
uniref:Uncharacterized protein n=1 Tax=Lactuca sativa TaxID=4236 RepID=A0A9R1WZH7_LACSA|nr:hypothetical protein LSAT_V11C800444550 [Lactuca sativa]